MIKKIIIYIILLLLSLYSGLFRGGYTDPAVWFQPDNFILLKLRIMQMAAAFAVGGCLAVSGTAYQAVLKNVLAEPFILGVSGGASLGAAAAIVCNLTVISGFFLPAGAFIGAFAAVFLVFLIAGFSADGGYSNRALLGGVVIGSICSSLLMFIVSVAGMSKLNSISWWMLGSLQLYNVNMLAVALTSALVGTFLLFLLGRHADAVALGEEMSHNFGVSARSAGIIILSIGSLMTAISVALAGIIGFVGLIVPHILRRTVGATHRKLFIWSLFGGGLFMIWCDLLSHCLYEAQEIPPGVITSFLGGPFFIYLLLSSSKRSR